MFYCYIHYFPLQIGMIGLVEREWIATLGAIEMADIIYEDFVAAARLLVKELQEEVKGTS